MSTFTPGHLGKWEELYRDLLEGETHPLTGEGTWMLGQKQGLFAVFDETGPVFITATSDIAKEARVCINGGGPSEFRTLMAVQDLGASPRTADRRSKSGPLAERLNRRASTMRYRVAQAPPSMLQALAAAFTVVADPRLNGPTALANRAIDALQ